MNLLEINIHIYAKDEADKNEALGIDVEPEVAVSKAMIDLNEVEGFCSIYYDDPFTGKEIPATGVYMKSGAYWTALMPYADFAWKMGRETKFVAV